MRSPLLVSFWMAVWSMALVFVLGVSGFQGTYVRI